MPGWRCGWLNVTRNANVSPDQPRVSYLHLKLFVADFFSQPFFVLEFSKLNQERGNGLVGLLLCIFWKAPTGMHTHAQPHLFIQEVCPLSIQISAIYIPLERCLWVVILSACLANGTGSGWVMGLSVVPLASS